MRAALAAVTTAWELSALFGVAFRGRRLAAGRGCLALRSGCRVGIFRLRTFGTFGRRSPAILVLVLALGHSLRVTHTALATGSTAHTALTTGSTAHSVRAASRTGV